MFSFVHHNANIRGDSHSLSFHDGINAGKRLIVHPVNVLDAVVHFDRNLLPREEAKVTLLQQGLQFYVIILAR